MNAPKLPPAVAHLEYLLDLPPDEEMEEHGYLEFLEARIAELRKHQALLAIHGVDVSELITILEAGAAELRPVRREVESAEEQLLQAIANAADARRKLVTTLEPFVKKMVEEAPFDPAVQETKELLEELRKEMPKE